MKTNLVFALSLMLLVFSCSKESSTVIEQDVTPIQPVITPQLTPIEIADHIENPIDFIREVIYEKKGNPTLKKDCLCQVLDWVNHSSVTQTSAVIHWGEPQYCGYYYLIIHNETANTYNYIQGNFVAGTSYPLNSLEACSDYEVFVGHIGDLCASKGISTIFTTDCKSYCTAGSNNPSELFIQNLSLFSDDFIWSADPSAGYVDKTNETLNIPLNTPTDFSAAGWCFDGNWTSDVFANLWIDFNDNGVFEPSELMYTFSDGPFSANSGCLSVSMPAFTTPSSIACGVRARYIISTDPILGPCVTVNRGQVMDFMINAGGC